MSPDRSRRVSTAPLVVTLPVVGLALLAVNTGQSASADESAPVEMMLEDLDFIVEDALRLEFVVVGDAPDIVPPTTTTLPPATTSTTVPDDSPESDREGAAAGRRPRVRSTGGGAAAPR